MSDTQTIQDAFDAVKSIEASVVDLKENAVTEADYKAGLNNLQTAFEEKLTVFNNALNASKHSNLAAGKIRITDGKFKHMTLDQALVRAEVEHGLATRPRSGVDPYEVKAENDKALADIEASITENDIDTHMGTVAKNIKDSVSPRMWKQTYEPLMNEAHNEVYAALDRGDGAGGELLPDLTAASQLANVLVDARVASTIPVYPMPSKSLDVTHAFAPVSLTRGTINVDAVESTPGTGKTTLVAEELATYNQVPDEVEEDSILSSTLGAVNANLVVTTGQELDDIIVNGNKVVTSSNINTNAAVAATHKYTVYDGLRATFVGNAGRTTAASGAFSEANIKAARIKMDKYGINPEELVILVDPTSYLEMLEFDNYVSIEKFGPLATNTTGRLGGYAGIDIVITDKIPNTTATGTYGASGNNKKTAMIYNVRQLLQGFRRLPRIETERDAKLRAWISVLSLRHAFVVANGRGNAVQGIPNIDNS